MKENKSKALHIILWVLQILIGGTFIMAGAAKAFQPIAELAAQIVWPGDIPAILTRFIGVSELLGGLGLILPAALRIQPRLTPFAAMALSVIMLLAALFHLYRGEYNAILMNVILGTLTLFIAWGRMKKAVISMD